MSKDKVEAKTAKVSAAVRAAWGVRCASRCADPSAPKRSEIEEAGPEIEVEWRGTVIGRGEPRKIAETLGQLSGMLDLGPHAEENTEVFAAMLVALACSRGGGSVGFGCGPGPKRLPGEQARVTWTLKDVGDHVDLVEERGT